MKKLIVIALAVMTQGCVPLLTGIKEIDVTKERTTYRFMTGFNTEASISGTDTLNNNKGIKPGN